MIDENQGTSDFS